MSKPATRSWITSIIASSPSTPARALYKYEILKSRLRSVAAPCANRGRQSAPGPTRKRASQHHGVTDLLPTAHHLAPKPERAPKPVSFNEVGPWPVPTRNDGSTTPAAGTLRRLVRFHPARFVRRRTWKLGFDPSAVGPRPSSTRLFHSTSGPPRSRAPAGREQPRTIVVPNMTVPVAPPNGKGRARLRQSR